MKVNGDIITKTEFERRQVQVLRAEGHSVHRRRRAEEGDRRDHARPDRRHDRRAADDAARPRARAEADRRGVRQGRRQHPQGKQARNGRSISGGAQAGRPDDGRPAEVARAADADLAGDAARGDGQGQHHRGRSAEVSRRPRPAVHDPWHDHDSRNPREGAGDQPGRQRGRRRSGQAEGRRCAQAGDRRRSRSSRWRPRCRTRRRRPTAVSSGRSTCRS